MKNITVLFLSLLMILPFSGKVVAQEKAKTKIAHVRQKGETVVFMLSSSRPFIFANNRYILHIDNKEFYSERQSFKNGIGSMTFLIPLDNFNALQEGADIYLTYGEVSTDNMDKEAMSKADFVSLWMLGKFSKTLLTK